MSLLHVANLTVALQGQKSAPPLLRDISFTLHARETLALVGESGSGKSLTAQAVMGLFSAPGPFIASGHVRFLGHDLVNTPPSAMRALWGSQIGLISQNPHASLNPTRKIGPQLLEAIRDPSTDGPARAIQMLRRVGIPDPEERFFCYPDELSGGMKQRVLIAMAIINHPKLLIADEPTTALDVTIQAQIIDLLIELKESLDMGLLFITHDLALVAQLADRVAVMQGGSIVESGSVDEIFYRPQHPYTQTLLASLLTLHA